MTSATPSDIKRLLGKLLPISVVADRLGLSRTSIYTMCNLGKLRMIQIGPRKGYRITEESLLAYERELIRQFAMQDE
jgi:excisionase family DNA binding protein